MAERDDFNPTPEQLLALHIFDILLHSKEGKFNDLDVSVVTPHDLAILEADASLTSQLRELRSAQALLQLEGRGQVALIRLSWSGKISLPKGISINGLTIIGGRQGELYTGDHLHPVTAGYYTRLTPSQHYYNENPNYDMILVLPI